METQDYLAMIEDLMATGNLTRLEDRFLTDVAAILNSNRELSADQQAKLMDIYEERT